MTWRLKHVAVLILALWVPVTMHCALESLPAFGFLQACCEEDEDKGAPADCRTAVCDGVESGFYRLENDPAAAPALVLIPVFCGWIELPADPNLIRPLPAPDPPEPLRPWHFLQRAAMPSRAPSIGA